MNGGHWNAGGEFAAGMRSTFPTNRKATPLLSAQQSRDADLALTVWRLRDEQNCAESIFGRTPGTLTQAERDTFERVTSERLLTGQKLHGALIWMQTTTHSGPRDIGDTEALEMVVQMKTGCTRDHAANVIATARRIDPARRKAYIAKALATGAVGGVASLGAATLSVKTGVLALIQVHSAAGAATTLGYLFGMGAALSTGVGALALGAVALASVEATRDVLDRLKAEYSDVAMTHAEQDRKILNYLLGGEYGHLVRG